MEKRQQTRARRKPRATSSDVLPTRTSGKPKIPLKWRKQYQALAGLRSQLIARKAGLGRDSFQESQNPALTTHIADTATDEFDRDLAVSMISSDQNALYEIESAIKRIEDGTYGTCELTGKKIDPARLAAIPWTRFSAAAEKHLEQSGEIRAAHLTGRATLAGNENGSPGQEEEDGE